MGYLSSIVVTCLVVTLVASYLYGALRIRGRGRKMTPALKAQVSVLLGLYLLLKAASYWLGRFSLTTSNRGPVTGLSYTDAARRAAGPDDPDRRRGPVRAAAVRERLAAPAALDRAWPSAGCSWPPCSSARCGRPWSTASASSRAPRPSTGVDRAQPVRDPEGVRPRPGHHHAGVRRQRQHADDHDGGARPAYGADPPARPEQADADVQRQAGDPGLLPVQDAARHRALPARRARPGRRDRGPRAQPRPGSRAARGPTTTSSTPTGTAWWRRRPTGWTRRPVPRSSSTAASRRRTRSR